MQDELRGLQAEINRKQTLVDELYDHADDDGQVQAFVYSPELAEAMQEEDLTDPNDALAVWEDDVNDLLDQRQALGDCRTAIRTDI